MPKKKLCSVPTHDQVAFADCDCGWRWKGDRPNAKRLALKLHRKNCEIAQDTTAMREVDWTGTNENPDIFDKGKKARKKQRFKERRSVEQELRSNAITYRAIDRVENGYTTTANTREELEATIRACRMTGKVAVMVDDDANLVGITGDPNDPLVKEMMRKFGMDTQ